MKFRFNISLALLFMMMTSLSFSQTEMYQQDNKLATDSDVKSTKEMKSKTVLIGKSEWMLENLNTEKYRNGEPIKQAKTAEEWAKCLKDKEGCWCYYENEKSNGEKYGKLYNWYAVNDSRGLAPKGWHIPTDEEWDDLVMELGGKEEAGKKMKSTIDWSETCNATNASGFFGIPAGFRSSEGKFFFKDTYALWWSATSYKNNTAWYMYLYCNLDFAVKYYYSKGDGFSIRCIKN